MNVIEQWLRDDKEDRRRIEVWRDGSQFGGALFVNGAATTYTKNGATLTAVLEGLDDDLASEAGRLLAAQRGDE